MPKPRAACWSQDTERTYKSFTPSAQGSGRIIQFSYGAERTSRPSPMLTTVLMGARLSYTQGTMRHSRQTGQEDTNERIHEVPDRHRHNHLGSLVRLPGSGDVVGTMLGNPDEVVSEIEPWGKTRYRWRMILGGILGRVPTRVVVADMLPKITSNGSWEYTLRLIHRRNVHWL